MANDYRLRGKSPRRQRTVARHPAKRNRRHTGAGNQNSPGRRRNDLTTVWIGY